MSDIVINDQTMQSHGNGLIMKVFEYDTAPSALTINVLDGYVALCYKNGEFVREVTGCGNKVKFDRAERKVGTSIKVIGVSKRPFRLAAGTSVQYSDKRYPQISASKVQAYGGLDVTVAVAKNLYYMHPEKELDVSKLQTDLQNDVLNKCLEDILRDYLADRHYDQIGLKMEDVYKGAEERFLKLLHSHGLKPIQNTFTARCRFAENDDYADKVHKLNADNYKQTQDKREAQQIERIMRSEVAAKQAAQSADAPSGNVRICACCGEKISDAKIGWCPKCGRKL